MEAEFTEKREGFEEKRITCKKYTLIISKTSFILLFGFHYLFMGIAMDMQIIVYNY